jgi:hypothetical protein
LGTPPAATEGINFISTFLIGFPRLHAELGFPASPHFSIRDFQGPRGNVIFLYLFDLILDFTLTGRPAFSHFSNCGHFILFIPSLALLEGRRPNFFVSLSCRSIASSPFSARQFLSPQQPGKSMISSRSHYFHDYAAGLMTKRDFDLLLDLPCSVRSSCGVY